MNGNEARNDQLTLNRIEAKTRRLVRSVEKLYEKHPAPDNFAFWGKFEEIDKRLGEKLQKRPLGDMDIEMIVREAEQSFTKLLRT